MKDGRDVFNFIRDYNQAFAKGEMFTFKNKNKALKFAMGSWKKGKYK